MPSPARSRRGRFGARLESLEARLVLDSTVVFNEVMYHPLGDAPGMEWVELHNQMAIDMDISGWSLAGGIDFEFPNGTVIPGGEYLVVAANPGLLGVPGAIGPFTGALSNSGETIELINNSDRLMDSIEYLDDGVWPSGADGSGASLAKTNRDSASGVPANWGASRQLAGTPGAANVDPAAISSLVINEVGAGNGATIELYNPGAVSVPLSGYVLARAGAGATAEHVFGSSSLAAGAYLSLTPATLGFSPLSGDRLFLYAPDKTQLLDATIVDAAAQGRYPDGGDWRFTTATTFGGANLVQIEDDVVINEIMYQHREIEAREASVVQETLLAIDSAWRYDQSGANLGTAWSARNFDDTSWPSSAALFYNETAALPAPKNTPLVLGPMTYYFRTTFDFAGDPATALLRLRTILDDGAVIYLNGFEVQRINLPDGDIAFDTSATVQVNNAEYSAPIEFSTEHLLVGENVLAVEVHQAGTLSSDVAFGIELVAVLEESPAIPYHESAEEWIELFNRGDAPIDVSGWQLDDAVSYVLPANTFIPAGGYLIVAAEPTLLAEQYPGITILGPWDGSLSNSNERIRLLDARRNPADEVHYFDGGRWPGAADGGGSSLELRDPWSDNSRAEAWAASDEGAKPDNAWHTFTYRGNGASSASPPVNYNEFVMGLLDSGEVLIDDIRVVENPDTPGPQLIQNSTFDAGTSTWRIIGNHSGSVIADPDDPTNQVLRLVATGQTEHMHNHAETTVKDGANYVTISNRNTYEISFRAKWISGSNQLNTRLWFNRLPETTRIPVVESNGSPGEENSRFEANAGPTFSDFRHGPVVPAANAPVTVSVAIDDPQGVDSATLYYSAAGGAWMPVTMTQNASGEYVGAIPGRAAGTVVQFYVEATDELGAKSTYPAEGVASRALYIVNDGLANLPLTHNVRIVMTAADTNLLFQNTNLMSNADIGATVIYNESEVFYNVGVRLKGSEHGRADSNRIGFILHFDPDHLFRGVQDSVAIDRSGGWRNGTSFGQDEIVIRQIFNHAGNMESMYDDLIRVIAPRSQYTGSAIMQMARYDSDFLDSQYENGSEGTAFEYELLYALSQTVGGVEGLKIPQESGVTGTSLGNLGDDPETYRNYYLIKNNRDRDDYASLIPALKTFSLSGAAFLAEAELRLDVDQWLRSFAASTLVGPGDNYATGSQHNLILYVRPSDGKLLYLPWDMDFAFVAASNSSLVQSNDLSKLLQSPKNFRNYYGHILDILDTSFNTNYMTYWTNHLDNFLPGQSFTSILSYIGQRSSFARSQLPAQVAFNITTNGGQPLEVNTPTTTITGDAWVNVREIRLEGLTEPLALTWLDADTWQATVPLAFGVNQLNFQAYGYQGQLLASDVIQVTSSAVDRPLQEYLRITELMYHPADPSAAEIAAGFTDAEEFEYLEIFNTSADVTLTLTGVRLATGIDFTFPAMTLAPGEYVIVAENLDALALRYDTSGMRIAGQYTGKLSNSGERLDLLDPTGAAILGFTYSDEWLPVTDGEGKSLVIIDVAGDTESWNVAASWRASNGATGSPGGPDVVATPGDTNGDGVVDLADLNNVRNNFGATGPGVVGDTNGDGQVDLTDLNAVRNNFGAGGANADLVAALSPSVAEPRQLIAPPSSREKATDRLLESLAWLEWQRLTESPDPVRPAAKGIAAKMLVGKRNV
jgi:hypothetical protein